MADLGTDTLGFKEQGMNDNCGVLILERGRELFASRVLVLSFRHAIM